MADGTVCISRWGEQPVMPCGDPREPARGSLAPPNGTRTCVLMGIGSFGLDFPVQFPHAAASAGGLKKPPANHSVAKIR
jgi:hypothetical protein